MGHYDDCYERDEEEARQRHEVSVKNQYEKMLAADDLSSDKIRDAVLYLLKCQWKHGSIPVEADIHIRRLEGREGFAS